jgi:hypothetical protein
MLVDQLELDVMTAGICLPCLTFVAFPLDSGDERKARREARKLTPILWLEGLELAVLVALETAKRDGVSGAIEAIEDVQRHGSRSPVVGAIVWRLAEQMVEDIERRRGERQSEPRGASASTGWPVTAAIVSKSRS